MCNSNNFVKQNSVKQELIVFSFRSNFLCLIDSPCSLPRAELEVQNYNNNKNNNNSSNHDIYNNNSNDSNNNK
jgi:hypothetical protein